MSNCKVNRYGCTRTFSINFICECRVRQPTLSCFLPETPLLSGILSDLPMWPSIRHFRNEKQFGASRILQSLVGPLLGMRRQAGHHFVPSNGITSVSKVANSFKNQ